MSHITASALHAFAGRGLDIQVVVTTTTTTTDFTAITFRVGAVISKTSLDAVDTATGFTVDVELTDSELDLDSGDHIWELLATLGSRVRTLAYGTFQISDAPTS
jgi:hypothetical protein